MMTVKYDTLELDLALDTVLYPAASIIYRSSFMHALMTDDDVQAEQNAT